MKDRILWTDLLLDGVDNLDVSVIVFLQELVVKPLTNLALKNS
jgi:hypothetical protein